jgi:Photosynthetic reaction centre cytochrome C subunit
MPERNSRRPAPALSAARPALLPVLGAALVLALSWALTPAPARAEWPPKPHNLQIFPEDIEAERLVEVMKSFTRALGVRCNYCHVGEEGAPLADFDFASDEKEHKQKARLMLQMADAINQDHLVPMWEEFGDHPGPDSWVRCVTCHRGKTEPEIEEALEPSPGG